MVAMLATIANSRQTIVDINRVAGGNKLISCLLYYFILNPVVVAFANPFRRGCWKLLKSEVDYQKFHS
jgi:hypothetical protein